MISREARGGCFLPLLNIGKEQEGATGKESGEGVWRRMWKAGDKRRTADESVSFWGPVCRLKRGGDRVSLANVKFFIFLNRKRQGEFHPEQPMERSALKLNEWQARFQIEFAPPEMEPPCLLRLG